MLILTSLSSSLQRRQKRSSLAGSFQRVNVLTVLSIVVGIVILFLYISSDKEDTDSEASLLFSVRGSGHQGESSRRRFLKYTPSLWEQLWLDNIQGWEKKHLICKKLKSEAQFPFVRAFMKTTCTHQYEGTPWCTVDDGTGEKRRFWFNLDTNKVSREDPPDLPPSGFTSWSQVFESRSPVKPFAPEELESNNEVPMVFSRFDFVDDFTGKQYSEYIEPLVSHLRHPLSACYQKASYTTRSYIIPPPGKSLSDKDSKKFYFDAGASRWSSGEGGPSLSFFTDVWKRHGIDFDHIECWEGTTKPEMFYASVPEEFKKRTHYNQQYIASSPDKKEPFVPSVIKSLAKKNDYVMFKLDIDSGNVERGTVEHLLSHPQDLAYIDEFLWEHHVEGNYLMKHAWKNSTDDMSVHDSYQYFLRLRQKGVRAHSWV